MHLDRTDERIVALLAEDGRRSFADVGQHVGLTPSAVKRRVDRLRAGGAVTGFTVLLDPAAVGWTVEGYVELFCRPSTPPAAIKAVAAECPEVVEASTVSGDADAVVKIVATDMRHFEQVLERLGSGRFVERTRSVLVLSPLLRRAAPTGRIDPSE